MTASRTRRSLAHYVAEGVASEARRQARDESNEMRDRRLAREPRECNVKRRHGGQTVTHVGSRRLQPKDRENSSRMPSVS